MNGIQPGQGRGLTCKPWSMCHWRALSVHRGRAPPSAHSAQPVTASNAVESVPCLDSRHGTHAKNETTACFSLLLAQYSRCWLWMGNLGDMPWHRRMAGCVYSRILVLGMGRFQAVVSFLAWTFVYIPGGSGGSGLFTRGCSL